MRIIAIETSTERGSVALLDGDRDAGSAEHRSPQRHAEHVLPLLEALLARAGWAKTSIDRLAVGVGPGSFVGLRVGIALGQGLALGWRRPLVGVTSLQAMAHAVPSELSGLRLALLDARRDEVFLAAYAPDGAVSRPPQVLARSAVAALVRELGGRRDHDVRVVGGVAAELGLATLRGEELDWPHARSVARLAAGLDPATALPSPLYVRGPGATLPVLPHSPFAAADR